VRREEDPRARPVRVARPGGRGRADGDGGEAGPQGARQAQAGDLRRARRRPGERGVLPQDRARLRVLLAVPRADREAGGGTGGRARFGGRERPALIDVALVIPARDEAMSLPHVLSALPRAGEGWRVRCVVVVDNGSVDGTAAAARSWGGDVVS